MAYEESSRGREMPRREFFDAVDTVLREAGYVRKRSKIYVAPIGNDLSALISLDGSEFLMSLYLGIVSKPTNKLALKILRELGEPLAMARGQLSWGVPLGLNWFRGAYFEDPATNHQRWWRFAPLGQETPEAFLQDLQTIARNLVAENGTLRVALANPDFGEPWQTVLEATAYAVAGNLPGFEKTVANVLTGIDRSRALAEQPAEPGSVRIVSSLQYDVQKYFDLVRKSCFKSG